MEWSLTVTGYNEVLENGVPKTGFEYEVYFSFESLEEATKFIINFQKHSSEYHKYILQVY